MEDKYRYHDKINQWVATTKQNLFTVLTGHIGHSLELSRLYMTTFFMVICNIGLAASHRQG